MAKGKGSVITSRISVTPMEDVEGVSTVWFGGIDFSSSLRFDPTDSRFLSTEGFDFNLEILVSPETFGFLVAFSFYPPRWTSSLVSSEYLQPSSFLLPGVFFKSIIIRIFEVEGVHHSI